MGAAFALGEIGSEKAVEHLILLLRDKDKNVRGQAAFALGEIGSEKAVEHLVPLLKDEDWGVRSTVADSLGTISKKLAEDELFCLIERLHEEEADEAVMEIKKIRKRRFLKMLDRS